MTTCIITFADENVLSYFKYCYPILKKWCNNMNYDLKVFSKNHTESTHHWMKIYYLLEVLKQNNYNLICFLDADIVINNMHLDLTTFLVDDKDIYICKNGWNGGELLNTGSILIKNTKNSLEFLEQVWSKHNGEYSNNYWHEQSIVNQLYGKYHYMIKPLEMRDLNSYGDDDIINAPNNNLYHFMAKSLDRKIEYVKNHINILKQKGILYD